jgi:hypothetical protein
MQNYIHPVLGLPIQKTIEIINFWAESNNYLDEIIHLMPPDKTELFSSIEDALNPRHSVTNDHDFYKVNSEYGCLESCYYWELPINECDWDSALEYWIRWKGEFK